MQRNVLSFNFTSSVRLLPPPSRLRYDPSRNICTHFVSLSPVDQFPCAETYACIASFVRYTHQGAVSNCERRQPSVHVPESKETAANAPTHDIYSLAGQARGMTGRDRRLSITLAATVVGAGTCAACLAIRPELSRTEWSHLQNWRKGSLWKRRTINAISRTSTRSHGYYQT